jgi:hypothetical protein
LKYVWKAWTYKSDSCSDSRVLVLERKNETCTHWTLNRRFPQNELQMCANKWPFHNSSGWSVASHRGGLSSRPGSMLGLRWTKRHWGRFSPSTSISPANYHSTNFSIIIITLGWHNRPIGNRSAEWTQMDSTPPPPPLYKLQYIKKNYKIINNNSDNLPRKLVLWCKIMFLSRI